MNTVEGNWRTHYLWDQVLTADGLLDILQRFMHLKVKEHRVLLVAEKYQTGLIKR